MRRAIVALLLVAAAASARADEPAPPEPPAAAAAPDAGPPPPAAEPDKVEEARKYFDAGRQAYEAADYLTAIRSFELAYAAAPRPPITFSLAQAYRRQYIVDNDAANLKLAVEKYRKYLDEVPQGGRRDDAVTYLGELQPQLLRLEAVQPVATAPARPVATQLMVTSLVAGAEASIDGDAPGKLPRTRDVAPGPHQIRVAAPGYVAEDMSGLAVEGRLVVIEARLREMPATLRVRGARGADVALNGRTISVEAGAIAVPAGRHLLTVARRGHEPLVRELELARGGAAVVDAELATTGQRKLATVILGGAALTLVGAGVTTGFALAAQHEARDLLDKQMAQNLTAEELDDYNAARRRRDEFVLASGILYGAAAVTAITGLILYLADNPRVPAIRSAEPTRLVPQLGPGELGASLIGHF